MFTASFSKDGVAVPERFFLYLLTLVLAVSIFAGSAHAAPKYAGIVVDASTGKVLYGEDPDGLRYPASLTKMMTLYLTFEALEARRISLGDRVPVSSKASAEPPSKLGVRAGGSVTVEQAIKALVTRSANDIATALGEFLGGSESRFAQMMNNKARALGMTRTTYRNAHGLPNTAQMTTARDQARLGMALRQHFPQYYGYFSTRSFQFGKQTIGNHNRLLGSVKGVDGIKTGYTRAAGSNLATSVVLDGRSIVAVVLGGRSSAARDAQMRKLVAAYLPKASRGGSSAALIAQAAPEAVSPARRMAALNLPNSGPVPQVRYEEQPAATAYASEPSQKRTITEAMNVAMAGAAAAPRPAAAIPTPAPEYVPAAQEVASAEGDMSSVDEVTTASTSRIPEADIAGWVIQVGVSPNEKAALNLLQSTQDKGGKVLRSAKPFTVAVNSNGSQLYRARFGGFGDQKDAVNACNALKKKGISCWASQQ